MTIKEQAYCAHAFLRAGCVTSLKRSHVYELLAASVGYPTYASFQHDAIWCDVPFSLTGIEPDLAALRARCREFGLPADESERILNGLPLFLREAGYAPIRFDALIVAVEGQEGDPGWQEWVCTHLVKSMQSTYGLNVESQRLLIEGLEAAARRGVPAAHLAIAKLLESEAMLSEEEEERIRNQVKHEGTWTSPFVSFADIQANIIRVHEKHRHHLLAAARGGDIRALLETADRYSDPTVLEQVPSDEMDPISMADIAREHGDGRKVRYWLTVAAQNGDTGAMRELILDHNEPTELAWVWMYLSRLLEDDLSRDRYEAINEDGTPDDDDIGGPAYVGGDEGIDLRPLSREADVIARQKAEQLLAHITLHGNRI